VMSGGRNDAPLIKRGVRVDVYIEKPPWLAVIPGYGLNLKFILGRGRRFVRLG